MDEIARKNRAAFEATGKRRVDPMTKKYWNKILSKSPETDYDHPLLYRDDKYDYLVISLYPGDRNEEVLKEGFEPIPPMYTEWCKSYVKKFKNTRTSIIEEIV